MSSCLCGSFSTLLEEKDRIASERRQLPHESEGARFRSYGVREAVNQVGVVLLAEVLLDRKLPKKTENDRLDAVADATHLDTDG